MHDLSDRQHDTFDNPAKMACRAGSLRVFRDSGRAGCTKPFCYNQAGREAMLMTTTVWGVVKDGLIGRVHHCQKGRGWRSTSVPLPEVPPELQEEFDAWERRECGIIRPGGTPGRRDGAR